MADVKIKPLRNHLIIQPIEAVEEKSSGGIILAKAAKEKPQEAIVKAVGPGFKKEDGTYSTIDIEVGARVLFSKYAGIEVKEDGETYLVVVEQDILAVYPPLA